MNITKVILIFSMSVLFVLASTKTNGQVMKPGLVTDADLRELLNTKYGEDQVLVNGKYFENIYTNDLGHPYFSSEEFKKGHLFIHGHKYDDLPLKYNIWEQSVLVAYEVESGTQITFIPPNEFITEFGFEDHLFKKREFDNKESQFFEEIYSGDVELLCSWKKDRDQSEHKITFMAYKFSYAQKEIYLVYKAKPYLLKSNKALVKLFPEYKNEINNYIKEHRLKLYKASNNQLGDLMIYIEGLIQLKI